MGKRIIKKIGGERIGSGAKMTVEAKGYGYSTHDVSKVRRTSISFGTIVPMGQWLMTSGSRMRMNLDALVTSNALLYQLYGSAKFQLDVFSVRMALYNPKMLLNLNDQGYKISDIKFPLMSLTTNGIESATNASNQQINPSALLRYLGVSANGQKTGAPTEDVTRKHMAMWLLMYYQIVKEYYANKQEKIGYMIHNIARDTGIEIKEFYRLQSGVRTNIENYYEYPTPIYLVTGDKIRLVFELTAGHELQEDEVKLWYVGEGAFYKVYPDIASAPATKITDGNTQTWEWEITTPDYGGTFDGYWIDRAIPEEKNSPRLQEWDLKAIDRMMMRIMANVETTAPIEIDSTTELPYGASFKSYGTFKSINGTQEGICLGTHQSDVFNNWLDNATINTLNAKNKVKVDENGEFNIDMLNITQKLYNYDMRIGITDGTLEEWRELTYGQKTVGKSLKPVYEGGLTKEILFDQIISTASTAEEPLGSIASRGNFGAKHKGGYVQIEADEEKLVMVLCKITPRIVYSQGNDWTTNLKTLEDLHKPALDKIGYQNLITDTMMAVETIVNADGTLTTYSAGKQPAWQWYRTNYDDALGNMADTEDYKVFGRSYEAELNGGVYRIKDLTTYIDPRKYNDVFAVSSIDAMNFDVQVGMDVKLTNVMSEEVIPNL